MHVENIYMYMYVVSRCILSCNRFFMFRFFLKPTQKYINKHTLTEKKTILELKK